MRLSPILVVTRPASTGDAFAREVLDGLVPPPRVILSPAFVIASTGARVPGGDVIFTSATAASLAPAGAGTAWCVGDATARAARARGWTTRSAQGDAEALVALVLHHRPAVPLTHLAGVHRHGDIAGRLTAAGLPCATIELYRQVPLPPTPDLLDATRGTAPLVAPVFSVRSLKALAVPDRSAPLHVVAISDAVARAASDLGASQVLTADRPDAVHMRKTTKTVLLDLIGS